MVLPKAATTKSKFSKEMLTVIEISTVFVIVFYIYFLLNLSIVKNMRQLVFNISFIFIFRFTPTIDKEPIFLTQYAHFHVIKYIEHTKQQMKYIHKCIIQHLHKYQLSFDLILMEQLHLLL